MTRSLADRVRSFSVPVRTRRLELITAGADLVGPMVALLNEPTVARWTLHIPYPYRASDARDYLRRSRASRRKGHSVSLQIVRRADGKLLGGVGLYNLDEARATAEVGYWVGRPYRRQGYGEEATRALVRLAFQRLGLHRVEATVFPGNVGSIRLLRRAGFRFEGRSREAVRKDGVWRTCLRFARLATDPVRPPRKARTT
jgi:[ribosomal protein S5]-alanine N-acetyltransferase